MEAALFIKDLLCNPEHTRWLSFVLIAAEAVLCPLIIWKVPYTEIDWQTYMQQVSLFLDGQRNYEKLSGDTGPLVYPALHVYIYSGLYYLTNRGTSIFTGQLIFYILYLCVLAVVLSCYVRVRAPPYLLPLLVLSKRVHSIFLLRLFNDCWAVLGLWGAVWFAQRSLWQGAALVWCLGVGVKMTVAVLAPAMGLLMVLALGNREAIFVGILLPQVQGALSLPFMDSAGGPYAYVTRAFDLSRKFLYKWTVNWRFISEETFLSDAFSYLLIHNHLWLLLLFFNTRWIAPTRCKGVIDFAKTYIGSLVWQKERRIAARVTPTFATDTLLTCMAIGMLCARSLHYQFFVYIAWGAPYLLWRAGIPFPIIYVICAAQEWAWLTFPSTDQSSLIVVGVLALQVAAIWIGTGYAKGEVAYDEEVDRKNTIQEIERSREDAVKAAEKKAHEHVHHHHEKSYAEAAATT